MEHGDGNPPRNLAGNIPIFKVFKIVDKDFLLTGGVEFDFAGFEVLDSGSGEFFCIDEPLLAKHRLDDGATFVTMGDGVGNSFLAAKEALFLEVGEDLFATFFSSEAGVSFPADWEHAAIWADDGEFF